MSKKIAAKRPIERSEETLDIEPINKDDISLNVDNSNPPEIDDPW